MWKFFLVICVYFLWFYYRQNQEVWLGYQNINGTWQWLDGTPFDFNNFPPGDPQGDNRCAYWKLANQWRKTDCDDEFRALCKLGSSGNFCFIFFFLFYYDFSRVEPHRVDFKRLCGDYSDSRNPTSYLAYYGSEVTITCTPDIPGYATLHGASPIIVNDLPDIDLKIEPRKPWRTALIDSMMHPISIPFYRLLIYCLISHKCTRKPFV